MKVGDLVKIKHKNGYFRKVGIIIGEAKSPFEGSFRVCWYMMKGTPNQNAIHRPWDLEVVA